MSCQIRRKFRFGDSAGHTQWYISPFPLKICRQFDAPYTPHLLPNTVPFSRIALCQPYTLSNPAQLRYCRFCFKYSIERTSVSVGDMSTTWCTFHSTFAAKYSASVPVNIISTRVKVKSNVFAVLYIQYPILFHGTFLQCYWLYHNCIRVILHICCQRQRRSIGSHNVNSLSC